ncbi:MAG: PAS domain S-box protein [Proteobacteria bacterium]|nr:PAS domain S-box protein [Pseudomonadota bacterium]
MKDAVDRSPFLTFGRSRWVFAILALAGVLNGLLGAWLVTSGPTDPVVHTANFLRFLVSPWMLATYVVVALLVGMGAWRLRNLPQAPSERAVDKTLRGRAIGFALVVAVASFVLMGIGYLYYREVEASTYAERTAEQQAVARLKSQQVGKWLVETTVNAEILAASIARMPLDRLPGDRDVAQVTGLLFAEALAINPERTSVTLFAANGSVLVHEGEGSGPDAATTDAVKALIASPAPSKVVDLHNNPGDPPQPRMAIVVPVAGTGARPLGWLAVALDPFRGILDKFNTWPTASRTSEVLLVHRVGDDVVYITPPKHLVPPPVPNTLALPLSNTRSPAVQTILQGPGARTGIDYSGTRVLTASDKVNGLPWYIGAKTDESEYEVPLRRLARRLAEVIGLGIAISVLCLWVLYRGERAALQSQAQSAELEHQAMTRHFEDLTQLARDVIFLSGPDGRIIEANEAASTVYGYAAEEFRGMPASDLRPPEARDGYDDAWRRYASPGGALIETVHRRKDGTTFPVEVSGRVLEVGGKPFYQAFVRDISERRALERQVARLSRVRTALQAGTSVLLRSRDETEMYERLCAVMVQQGGYVMANVALPVDDPDKTVRYAAVAGVDDGYLAQAHISWGDVPRGHGPLGTALRTGEMQVNQDFISNPLAAPWRDEALKRGYRSSIAIPLKDGDRTFAALTLYASEPDAFDDDEVTLLSKLCADLAYAAVAASRRRAA